MPRRLLFRVLRLGAALVLVWMAFNALRSGWSSEEFLAILSRASVPWLIAACLTVAATYGASVEAWRRAMMDQGARLSMWRAARIFCLANLGKYLPGRVWSIVGAGLLARDEGIPSRIAIGITLLVQIQTLATGLVVAAIFAPSELDRFGGATTPMTAAIAVTVLAISGSLLIPRFRKMLDLKLPRFARQLPRIKLSTWLAVIALSVAVWCGFGAALMMMDRSLSGSNLLPFSTATGVFAASYVLGFVALLAPAGIGPREASFIVLLTPTVGPLHATALALVSRVAVTIADVATALPFLRSLVRGAAQRKYDPESLFSDPK